MIELLIKEAENSKKHFKVNLCSAAAICDIPYKTFLRYKKRMNEGKTIIEKRGRKTLPPLDLHLVKTEIHNMKHGRKRTAGTEVLRDKYHGIISRAELNALIAEVREDVKAGRRLHMTRIQWDCPHMVWSMDDFEYPCKGITFYVHQVQDLTSKYKFEPLVGCEPLKGEEIAGNLKKLFKLYKAPLFMKRDNGSNLNHIAVIDVLQESRVIPLNNPAYYPQFNGSMERAQGEVKKELDNLVWEFDSPDSFPFAVKQAVNNINHKPRPSLNGAWSCSVWQLHANVCFSQQERFNAYCEIYQLAFDIEKEVQYIDKELVKCKSWRKAVQTWLHQNGHIIIKRNGKVSPISA